MTRKDEDYLFRMIERIRDETHENNKLLKENNFMLKQMIQVFNYYLSNANQENENDFIRNILANLISSAIDITKLARR